MYLCFDCYEKLKEVPNIVKTGSGISCFGGYKTCEECNSKISKFVKAEVSNDGVKEAVKNTVIKHFKSTLKYHSMASHIDKDRALKVEPLTEEEILKKSKGKYEIGN